MIGKDAFQVRRQDSLLELTKTLSELSSVKLMMSNLKQSQRFSIQEMKVEAQFGQFAELVRKHLFELIRKKQSQQVKLYFKLIKQAEDKLLQIKQKCKKNDQNLQQILDILFDIAKELQSISQKIKAKEKKKYSVQCNQQMLQKVIYHCISVHIDGDQVFKPQKRGQNEQDNEKEDQQPKIQQKIINNFQMDKLSNSAKDQDIWLISPLENKHQVHRYNISRKVLYIQHSKVQFQGGYGLCMIRNVCYIAGGYDNENKPIGKCFRIDTSSVSSMKRLNKSRNRLALTGLGEKYVIATGGRIQKSIVVSERYSIAKEKWEFINDLNEGRSAHSSCQFRNRFVFVFMGTNGTNDINSIQRFDQNGGQTWKIVIVRQRYDDLIATNCLGSSQVNDGFYLWSKFMNNYKSFFKFEFQKDIQDDKENDQETPVLNCYQINYGEKFCNTDSTCPIRWSIKDNFIYSLEYANKSLWKFKDDKWTQIKEDQFEIKIVESN